MKRPQLYIYCFDLELKERGRTHLCGDIKVWVNILAENEQEARDNLVGHVIKTYERRVSFQDEIVTTLRTVEPLDRNGVLRHGMSNW